MKAFFEKLTTPGQSITTRDSVIRNIERILCFGSFLDAGVDSVAGDIQNRYRNGLLSVVDVSLSHQQQIAHFHIILAQLVAMHEPRIKEIQVLDMKNRGQGSYCQLKICLHSEVFEQGFIFG